MKTVSDNSAGLAVFLAIEETPMFVRRHIQEKCWRLRIDCTVIDLNERHVYDYDMISLIACATIILVDMTKSSKELHYFLGAAIGFDRPIILVENRDTRRPIPADVARIATIEYSTESFSGSGFEWKVQNEITRAVESPRSYKLLPNIQTRTNVFVSYSRSDGQFLLPYRPAMQFLEDNFRIQFFLDENIDAGEQWKAEIERQLNEANIAIILTSPSFYTSPFIRDVELPRIKTAYETGKLLLLPIVLKACKHPSWVDKTVQAINTPKEPVDEMGTSEFAAHLIEFQSRVVAGDKGVRIRMAQDMAANL